MKPALTKTLSALVMLSVVCASALTAEEFDLTWRTVDGGGVMRSAAGGIELSGTIGQPDAGRMSADKLTLTGGFWFEVGPADCNADGGIDLTDFLVFQGCLFGPEIPVGMGPQCECSDINGNGTVDMLDFAEFQNSTNGQ